MIRTLKALGIASVAVFAMSAIAASAAHATSAHAKCTGVETCEIKVTQHPELGTQSFSVPPIGTVKCKQFHGVYKGTATLSESSTLTGIRYEECEFLGLEATVNFEGVAGKPCDYTLTAPLETVEEHGRGGVKFGPAGCKVKIVTTTCTLTVEGEQSFPTAITYTNTKTGEREYITGHADTGKEVKVTGEGIACPGYSSAEGRYVGTFTAEALDTTGNPISLAVVDT